MFRLRSKGDFSKTFKFFEKASNIDYDAILSPFGKEGVLLLSSATPIESGKTSQSWDYFVEKTAGGARIVWTNHNLTSDGQCIAIMLQYGHGTGTGGYVQGRDYINPAMRPLFDRLAEEAWKAVVTL